MILACTDVKSSKVTLSLDLKDEKRARKYISTSKDGLATLLKGLPLTVLDRFGKGWRMTMNCPYRKGAT